MLSKYLEKLEYDKIIKNLAQYAKTFIGKKYCLSLVPFHEKNKVIKALNETNEAVLLRYKKGSIPIYEFSEDINVSLKTLKSNKTLSIVDVLNIGKILKLSSELKSYFFSDELIELNDFNTIYSYFDNLYINKNIENKIFSAIIDKFTIDDKASSTLYNIRSAKRKIDQEIKNKLNNYISSSSYSKYLQDPVVTIKNDRYVIPVKEEYKNNIKGFIHDMSNSGSTVFIEPISVFDLNSKISTLTVEENIEIEKILTNFTSMLFEILDELENDLRLIGLLDFIFAKANYSIVLNATKPLLNENKEINLIKARHPLIDSSTVVPININLGINFNTLVITGPNTGGKTVTLKTTGLIVLMAMSGLNIPASENSSVFVFDNIFADIGDEQSIQESLSTFSSHMLNIIEILNNSTSNSLVLVDELGSGTDPMQGSSLAISILEHLHNNNTLTIATTHYPEIKNYVLTHSGFENASQEFNLETLSPTYRLLIGVPGKSNAFEISKKLGLSETILKRANSFLDSDTIYIEDLLKSIYDNKLKIEHEKSEIDKKLVQISKLQDSLEKDVSNVRNKQNEIINKAKLEAREILYSAKDEATTIIRQMRKIEHNSGNLKDLDNFRNSLNNSIKELSATRNSSTSFSTLDVKALRIGMDVYVKKFMTNAVLLTLPNKNNEVQVQCGNMKSFVPISDISISTNKKTSSNIPSKSFSTSTKSKNISSEINVIGQTVDEAIFVIDKYLDDCSLAKLKTARIVHGKGTGKLRSGIHTFLRKHPHVKSFRLGTFGEGEMGVTIVEIK